MTIFELFPWLLAISVGLFSTIALYRLGMSEFGSCALGLSTGIIVIMAHIFFAKRVLPWLQLRKAEQERLEVKNRNYQLLGLPGSHPKAKNLYYECLVCGNVVLSVSRKDSACACQNILVEANSGRIDIRNADKVRLFTLN